MTDYVKLPGKFKWARLVQPDEKYERWSIVVYLTDEGKTIFDGLGLQLSVKSDEDGEFVTFGRPQQKKFGKELQEFEPPKVFDQDNNLIDGSNIGNGSEGWVKIAVFDTKKGKGHRLESVRVDKLVKYEKKEGEYF